MLRIFLLLSLLLAGCNLPPEAARHPEIDFWEGVFYIGDPRDGSLQAVSVRNSPVILARSFIPERKGILRVKVVPAREQVWVLDSNAVYVHELKTLALQRRVSLGQGEFADIVLDGQGNGYVIANNEPAIYRIDGGAVAPWLALPDEPPRLESGRNSLALSPDGEHLFALIPSQAKLWKVRISDRNFAPLDQRESFAFGCALAWGPIWAETEMGGAIWAGGASLQVMSCARRVMAQLRLTGDLRLARGSAIDSQNHLAVHPSSDLAAAGRSCLCEGRNVE
jgi:hypothetical protein